MSNNFEFVPGNVKAVMKEVGATSADLWQVAYEDLHIQPGFNVREKDADYKAHVANIASLMVANGYYRDKPMAGYVAVIGGKNRIVVTDGHCRHEAVALARSQGADIVKVPVVVKPSGTSEEDLIVAMVASNSGKPLTPYEIGTVCKRLQAFGWDEKKISGHLNFTNTYVTDLLFLQGCPKAVRKLVQEGKVSAATAIAAVRQHGEKAAEVLTGAVEKAEASGKTKATKKDLAPTFKGEVKKRAPALYDALKNVCEDAAYAKLHKVTKDAIAAALDALPEEPTK
jgi:ParB family chromosome partitioning protein